MRRLIKSRWFLALLGVAIALAGVGFIKWKAIIDGANMPHADPFRIAGNLYYVGTIDETAFLLTGPDGHVLIDGGNQLTAPRIVQSIATLGFDIADVRVLLATHAHSGHVGGLAALQEASGAELWVSEGDSDVLAAGGAGDLTTRWLPLQVLDLLRLSRYPAPRVDHRFRDGTTIRVGPLELTAHVTAGHTPGCTTWSFPVRDGDRELRAVNICSLTVLPWISFVEPESYPGVRTDFERSFRTLRSLPVDIFLGSHASFFGMAAKIRARRDADDPAEPFIDPAGYHAYIDRAEETLRSVLAEQQQRP
jgi:metallo-beta-lactamase class B